MDENKIEVTPFVGVWIETSLSSLSSADLMVTPFVGVWIETLIVSRNSPLAFVTPFVGVWIETFDFSHISHASLSHTLRGCVD